MIEIEKLKVGMRIKAILSILDLTKGHIYTITKIKEDEGRIYYKDEQGNSNYAMNDDLRLFTYAKIDWKSRLG